MGGETLESWRLFCTLCRRHGQDICNDVVRRKLNRFSARYNLADRFQFISASEFSSDALRGYSAGLKLFMTYNAAELLGEAIGEPVHTWIIENSNLANQLRRTLQKAHLDESGIFTSKGLRKKLSDFMNGTSTDVRVAATALRVMFAHGSFTPTGVDSLSKKGGDAIIELASILNATCDSKFTEWVQRQTKRLNS
ncbi:hypothetical protein MCEGEM3_02630 [Oxalobacteraceae bacterium]